MKSSKNNRRQHKHQTFDFPKDFKEPDWSKLRFSDVNRLVEKHERGKTLNIEEEQILGRWVEFDNFWDNRVFPPGDTRLLREAFLDVMVRLSSEVFDFLTSKIWIASPSSDHRAVNVPVRELIQPHKEPLEFARDVIVFSDQYRKLSPQARIGLVAHELAHSCVEKPQHSENETAADDLVKFWGFSQELKALRKR